MRTDNTETLYNALKKIEELEEALEKMRILAIEVSEIAYMEAGDEFGLSWEDFKYYVLYERIKIMTDEEVDR